MKATILDGERQGEELLTLARAALVAELERLGWEVELISLRQLKIKHCLGCFGCWIQTPGICVQDDAARGVTRSLARSDLAVFLTPVTFGGYSSELKKVLDRSIGLIMPFFHKVKGEVHHLKRYDHAALIVGLGWLPQADEESERIFATLLERNAINLHAPAYAAGVVRGTEGAAEAEATVRQLLAAVGVE